MKNRFGSNFIQSIGTLKTNGRQIFSDIGQSTWKLWAITCKLLYQCINIHDAYIHVYIYSFYMYVL